MARRFAINPNTVSAGYRQLEREGWTERRHGSGVYVRANAEPPTTPEQILDQHIAGFFRAVRELSLPAPAIRGRVADWLIATTFLQAYMRRCPLESFGSLQYLLVGAEKLPERLAQEFLVEVLSSVFLVVAFLRVFPRRFAKSSSQLIALQSKCVLDEKQGETGSEIACCMC